MKIGIDIDDTISKTTEQTDIYAKEYTEKILKREFKLNKINTNDPMGARYVYGWSIEEDKKFWDLYYEKDMENVKPKNDAAKVINELYKDNEIIIITARWDRGSGIINKITKDWLEKYDIHYNKLYMDHQDKRNIALDNKIDLFIDDSIKICQEIQGIGIKAFIMNSRINENIDVGDITRVKDWIEIYEKIESIREYK